jgi:hypothetical protein
MADIPMESMGSSAENLETVANLLSRAQELQGKGGHSTVTRNIVNQLCLTLPQVYSALQNGDSGLASTLLSDLDGLEEQLDDVAGNVSLTMGLSEVLTQARKLQAKL